MTSNVLAKPSASISITRNVLIFLRSLQRSFINRSKANPAMAMFMLTASIYFWVNQFRKSHQRKKRMRQKGGIPVPLIKSKLFMLDVFYSYVKSRYQGKELQWVQALSNQHLTLSTEAVGHHLILVFEPSSVQHILVKNFENYPKGKSQIILIKSFIPYHKKKSMLVLSKLFINLMKLSTVKKKITTIIIIISSHYIILYSLILFD
jgi:hypothetical protein